MQHHQCEQGLLEFLQKLENFMIRSELRLSHDFHLIFFFNLEFLEDVVTQENADDEWDELNSFLRSCQLLDDLLQQFRLLFENFNLEFDDLLDLIDG